MPRSHLDDMPWIEQGEIDYNAWDIKYDYGGAYRSFPDAPDLNNPKLYQKEAMYQLERFAQQVELIKQWTQRMDGFIQASRKNYPAYRRHGIPKDPDDD